MVSNAVVNATSGSATFDKPSDNIGTKTIPDYAGYAAQHIYTVSIPGCAFPGQACSPGSGRKVFAVNLGAIFDLVNAPVSVITDPTLINAAAANSIQNKNVTTLAVEVHKSCLTQGSDPVIGGWTTSSVRQSQLVNAEPGAWAYGTSTSVRWCLGAGVAAGHAAGERGGHRPARDKDRFNASLSPSGDGQLRPLRHQPHFAGAAGNRAGPAWHGADESFRGNDLVTTFLTGITGVNKPANVVASEMLRLNTAIPAVPFAHAEPAGHRRQHPGRWLRQRRLPERAPSRRTTWWTSRWWR